MHTASISGKAGQPWLSVYSATKAAVIGFSQATQKENANLGIQVTALAPAFVDTPMTEFVKGQVAAEAVVWAARNPRAADSSAGRAASCS